MGKSKIMNILIVMLYLVGAYGLFMAVTYVLAKFLFPKVEEDNEQKTKRLQINQLKKKFPPKVSSKMKQLKKNEGEEKLAF